MLLTLLFACNNNYRLTHPGRDTAEKGEESDADTDTDADTDADTDSDTDTDTDADTDTVPRTDCANILVYSTEGASGAGRNRGAFAGLESDSALTGFDVTVHERVVHGDLDSADLVGRSQVWVFGADADFGSTLALSEVSAIARFVGEGGGLLLVGEHTTGDESYSEDVNLLAEAYGVSFDGSARESADGELVAVDDVAASVAAGVSRLPGFSSVAELEATDSAVKVGLTIGGQPALLYRDDGQHVVFDRSWEGWTDTWRAEGDQPTLVADVARFLEPCTE